MASVFWNANEIIFIDSLEKGNTINSEYSVTGAFKVQNRGKRPHLKNNNVLFHYDKQWQKYINWVWNVDANIHRIFRIGLLVTTDCSQT